MINTFQTLNQTIDSLRAKLDDSDSDGDLEESKVTLTQCPEWNDPSHPNTPTFLRNLFNLKMDRFRFDNGNKDIKSTTLHELFTYRSNRLPNLLTQKF